MTYLPPANGGRINATIGGNTAGAGALVSSGTLTLAGGDNVTLSQNGNAITISGGAGGGANTLGMSNLGNTVGTSGVISGTALQLALAGGNNITLSQSINGSSATVTVSAFNQSNQSIGLYGLGNTTQNSSTTLDARSLSLNGLGMVTVGYSNGSIQLSATQTNQSVGLYALGNTTQNSSTTRDARSLSFNGLGGITVGYSNGSIQLSGPQTVAQTNQTVGLYALGNTTQNSSTTLDARTISFNGLGGATVGYSNGSVQISAPQTVAQTNQTLGLYAVGNTTGQSSSSTFDARTLSFNGAGIASVGYSGGSVVVSVPAGGGGITNINLSAGTTSNNLSNVTFSNANGVSFGLNASTLTASIAAQTNQTVGLYAVGNTTQNSSTTLDARTLSFNGLGAATMGYSNGSVQVSAPATSSLSATGAVSISTNGSTISIGAPSITTLSRFEYYEGLFTSLNTIGQGSLSINHMYVPFFVTGTAMKIGGSLSASTNTSATTASANISLWMGIYTLNGSTLSLASSGSANNGFQWSQSASSTGNTSINSMRQMTAPVNVNMTPGEYWVAAVISSATTYTGAAFTIYGNNQVANAATAAVLSPIGSNTSANRDAMLFQGIYNTATSVGPTTIAGSQINNTSASNVQRANFYNVIFNATY